MSQVNICNQALTSLGASTIINLDDDTTEAKICKLHYQLTFDFMLESIAPSFARVRMELPTASGTYPEPYPYKFLIPVDIIRVIEAGEDPNFLTENSTEWQVEDDYIVANSASMHILGVTNSITTAKLSGAFTKAFVAMMAANIALAVTSSTSIEKSKQAEAANLLMLANTLDSTQGKTRKLRSNKYLNARNRSGGQYYKSYEQG